MVMRDANPELAPTAPRRARGAPGMAAALALAALAWAGTARAEPRGEASGLERAREQIGELRYDRALTTLDRSIEAGTSGPALTAQLYLLLGEVRATLGKDEEAEAAFGRALAIDPGLELRKGVSPKISRPFRRARRARHGAGPITIAQRREGPTSNRIEVVVQSDPVGLVTGARVVCWAPGAAPRTLADATASRSGGGSEREVRFQVELPPGTARFTVAGVDQHGNRVVELGTEDQPLLVETTEAAPRPPAESDEPAAGPPSAVVAGAEKQRPAPPERTPFYASWLLWGGVAVAIGGAGAWAGVTAQSAVDDLDEIRASEYEVEYSEAKRIADRAETRSLIANICFGAAGASAVVSAILFVRSRRHRSAETTAVAPLVGRDQIGVAATLRF
jgi:hypothetical protein